MDSAWLSTAVDWQPVWNHLQQNINIRKVYQKKTTKKTPQGIPIPLKNQTYNLLVLLYSSLLIVVSNLFLMPINTPFVSQSEYWLQFVIFSQIP